MTTEERLVYIIMHYIEAYQCDCDASEPVARELIEMIREYDANPQRYQNPPGFETWLDRRLKWYSDRKAAGLPI